MKEQARRIGNQHLKTERELRGWSQKYVAEQLGADHYYLSRWERGTSAPSPYYRQKLCELFGKDARALGLLRDEASLPEVDPSFKQEAGRMFYFQSPGQPVYDPSIPLFVAEGTGLVGRDALLEEVKKRLCRDQGLPVAALDGLPGVGKTALAATLAQDPALKSHFPDGVLWAGLGPNPDMLSHLSRWGILLGLPGAEAGKLHTVEEWIRALRLLIGTRHLLLVIDDAWRIEAALTLKFGGPNCAYLLTSRFPPLALQFAPNDTVTVPELPGEDGVTLLARLTPDVVARERDQARLLVQAAGGLPLALTIMGKYLRKESHSQQPRRIRAALKRLQDVQERLLVTMPYSASEQSSSLPSGSTISLYTVIEFGTRGLSEAARVALLTLAVFPAKPGSFTEEAALTVSEASGETLDELTDSGLLEGCEYGRYTMHQLIADYARSHLLGEQVYARLIDYIVTYLGTHQKDYDMLEQELENISAALQVASQAKHFTELIRGVNALTPFLLASGQFVLAKTHLLRAEEAARFSEDRSGLATVLLYLGKVLYNQGDLERASEILHEGLEIARQYEDPERLCRLLDTLGIVARFQGNYERSERYHQEGLLLAREQQSQELTCTLLKSLGIDCGEQGRYREEADLYREGIILARQAGDAERLTELLINLGQATFAIGDYVQAMDYSQEALALCRRLGYRHALTTLLADIGGMATDQKNYAQAEIYLQEALELARQMEHRNLITVTLVNLGATVAEQKNYEQAEVYLQEALENARIVGRQWLLCGALHGLGDLYLQLERFSQARVCFQELRATASHENQEYQAVALFGLARAELGTGNVTEARSLGQESLAMFQAIHNRQLPQVRAWLEKLS